MRDSAPPPRSLLPCVIRATNEFEWSMRSLEIKMVQKAVSVIQKICNCSNSMLSDSKHVPHENKDVLWPVRQTFILYILSDCGNMWLFN